MSKLSMFLKREREARDWTMTDLSERSGIPLSTLSRWENPKSRAKPGHDNILLLAAAFNMPPDHVLKFIGYPVRPSNNGNERAQRWEQQRALLEGDPRAARILEMFEEAGDEEKDAALTILEAHFNSRRRPGRGRRRPD